jgi:hypothetical protein
VIGFGCDVTLTEATYEVKTRSKAKYDVTKRPEGVTLGQRKPGPVSGWNFDVSKSDFGMSCRKAAISSHSHLNVK